ncbi:hypothetical protein ACQF36_38875 [Streptomyces sp. Marseille-Q5077]|uniref:hypothetical protein n=1 Tax=Streptomyces sp. Marseille-Q5077 TaxID=3418995 RepID=UPI003D0873F6
MEDPPEEGDAESPYSYFPHSQREIHSVHLQLSLASSEVERKQILYSFGMTIEEFSELFEHRYGSTGPDDG